MQPRFVSLTDLTGYSYLVLGATPSEAILR